MQLVNKRAVAAAFGRAAESYSSYDILQRYSAQRLRMLLGMSSFATVLDAGCGPGENSRIWRLFNSKVIALDLSQEMIIRARKRKAADIYLVADIEALPLSDSYFDLVWSHLAVQWCSSLKKALSELYRVTNPGGVVAFTTLLDRSLLELRQAWSAVDIYPHANRFLSQEAVVTALIPWSYRFSVQNITIKFNDARAAMRSLKGIGATHLHDERPRKVFTRNELHRLELAWPKWQGQFPLTYQLFHAIIKRD